LQRRGTTQEIHGETAGTWANAASPCSLGRPAKVLAMCWLSSTPAVVQITSMACLNRSFRHLPRILSLSLDIGREHREPRSPDGGRGSMCTGARLFHATKVAAQTRGHMDTYALCRITRLTKVTSAQPAAASRFIRAHQRQAARQRPPQSRTRGERKFRPRNPAVPEPMAARARSIAAAQ